MTRLQPSVREFVTARSRKFRTCGDHLSMVVASRVVSARSAVAQAVKEIVQPGPDGPPVRIAGQQHPQPFLARPPPDLVGGVLGREDVDQALLVVRTATQGWGIPGRLRVVDLVSWGIAATKDPGRGTMRSGGRTRHRTPSSQMLPEVTFSLNVSFSWAPKGPLAVSAR